MLITSQNNPSRYDASEHFRIYTAPKDRPPRLLEPRHQDSSCKRYVDVQRRRQEAIVDLEDLWKRADRILDVAGGIGNCTGRYRGCFEDDPPSISSKH
ncbi:hypothetical protein BGZ65_004197 [Modicella reniformis]|uniref:Uncharacterized protein n=1 Tax=Modicella reniformis TaxID=1440133 RepID=A0A9P6MHE9_9FUNG|nr:hypothetical protein BGZ65_004197 [Modicella reniformis]